MEDDLKIKAKPTKDLFIYMLTADLRHPEAIAELVDNSIDGAIRERKESSLKDKCVKIDITPDTFIIADNCGGISIEIAREYAFNFGRPPGSPSVDGSIGRFGVGMKRALFKIGNKFTVQSHTDTDYFKLTVDVEAWSQRPEDWSFVFDEVGPYTEENKMDWNTIITVENLNEAATKLFSTPTFINELIEHLRQQEQGYLERGFTIIINGHHINFEASELLYSEELKPARKFIDMEDVKIEIFAGVGESEHKKAGWYIYCNERLVVEADKSWISGWGKDNIPNFHAQYNRFRGYVFFTATDSKLLPWNTTKTGIDDEAPIYQKVLLDMKNYTRSVVDFLNALDREKDQEEVVLTEVVDSSNSIAINSLPKSTLSEVFERPLGKIVRKPKDIRISYTMEPEKVGIVKERLGARSYKEIGEMTFDYYMRMECEPLDH